MKAREWSVAARPLEPILSGFHPIKRGFARQHEWIAECVYADPSSNSKSMFYLEEVFVLPLFIPTEYLYFNYGFRIGGIWDEVGTELTQALREALPRLASLATIGGL